MDSKNAKIYSTNKKGHGYTMFAKKNFAALILINLFLLNFAIAKVHGDIQVIPADQALNILKNGNARYLKEDFRKDGISQEHRKKISGNQNPHSIILGCSDSRVPPELVFDQKLGEIFTLRTAGKVIDSSVLASVEYAVSHLGSTLLVVMGHTECGAVKAAVATLNGGDAGSEHLNKMVQDIHPRLSKGTENSHSPEYAVEAWENAKGISEDLAKRSQIINQKIKSGQLKIIPALYHLDSGKVDWNEPLQNKQ